jgi:glycosyltransferase involved in cell wall biosynthesis
VTAARPLRVLALVPYPTGRVPGQRYRIEQWTPLMKESGIEVTFAPFLSARGMDLLYQGGHRPAKIAETVLGFTRRFAQRRTRGDFDVAYVYREAALLAPAWLERLFIGGLPFVFDFDDALYIPTASAANAWAARLRSPQRVIASCRAARHVMVGNEVLAQFARPHARAVTIVPSTVDLAQYAPAVREENVRPIVGWTGSGTTQPHLAALGPALARLRQEVDYELRVIGDGAPDLPGVDVVRVPWRAETEAADLRDLDVGLMPVPDDEWGRGKCGMKAIQYMALGIPPVVSPVGMNTTLVGDGVSGFHARTPDDWVTAIARLLRDGALRRRMGAAARETVVAGYTAQVQAPRVAQLLRDSAGGA